MSRLGGQLATGHRHDPDRLHLFHVDARGELRGILRTEAPGDAPGGAPAAGGSGGWTAATLPQPDGFPYGSEMHPPAALATGYRAPNNRLDVLGVDRDGMMRVYWSVGARWQGDVVPEAVGIPPGAPVATGYEQGGAVLDVFTVGRNDEPLLFRHGVDGRWRADAPQLDARLPHYANLATGYLEGRELLAFFCVDGSGAPVAGVLTRDGGWRTEWPAEHLPHPPAFAPGAPLATGYRSGGHDPSVFAVDGTGTLREFRRERTGWRAAALPVEGMPVPACVATGYDEGGGRLLVFVVDDAGRLRQYTDEANGRWSAGLVPNGSGLPPGAPLAVGYRAGGAVLDLFVLVSFAQPPLCFSAGAGGWTGPHRI